MVDRYGYYGDEITEFSPQGLIQKMRNSLAAFDRIVPGAEKSAEKDKAEAISLAEQLAKPFEHEARLKEAQEEHQNVFRELRRQGGGVEMTPAMRKELEKAIAERNKERAAQPGTADEDGVVFQRRKDTAGQPMTKQAITAVLDRLAGTWANAPEVVILTDISQAPSIVREAAAREGSSGHAAAFFYRGRVYIIASQMRSERDVEIALLHEAVGHYGVRQAFGPELTPILDTLIRTRRRAVAARTRAEGLDPTNIEHLRRGAEELIAYLAEKSPQANIVQRFFAAIRAGLRRLGINAKMGDADIVREIIEPSRRFLAGDQAPATSPDAGPIVKAPAFQRHDDPDPFHPDTMRRTTAANAVSWLAQQVSDRRLNAPRFKWWRAINTQYHKATLNPYYKAVFDKVQAYQQDLSLFANNAADLAPTLLPNITKLRDLASAAKIKDADLKKVADAIFEGTLSGGPNPAEGTVYTPDQLREQFDLTDEQIALYQEFRHATDKSLDDYGRTELLRFLGREAPDGLREAMIAAPDMASAAAMARQAILAEIGTMPEEATEQREEAQDLVALIDARLERVEALKNGGYAPLMRFGKHAVWIRRPFTDDDGSQGMETLWFSAHESLAEANQTARAMMETLGTDDPSVELRQGTMSEQDHKLFAGITPETLEVFGTAAGFENDPVWKQYVKLVKNNRSALKRMLDRKGTPGFSQDLPRVLAAFITSNARAASGNVHAGDTLERVQAIPQNMGDVKDEAVKLVSYMRDPIEEAQAVRGAMFIWFLGGSVASAAVNLTQPITMTFPFLAGKESARRAVGRLATAARLVATHTYDGTLREALMRAKAEGITEPQEIHQLQAEASRNMGSNLTWRKAMFAWGYMFSAAERMNRLLSFVAAFNQGRDRGVDNPYEYARNAVIETQGIYNRANRPNLARGAVGATVMTFKQYSIAYLEFVSRLLKSNNPQERRAGVLAIGVLIVLSGLQGLPFMEDLDDVIDTLAQAAGFNVQMDNLKERVLTEAFGDRGSQLLMRGASSLPGMPIDVQARLGLANLIPGTSAFKKSAPPSAGTRELLEVAGVAGSVIGQAGRAIDAGLSGELSKAAKAFMPVAITNAIKAMDMAQTGYYRDTRGRRVTEVSTMDAFWKSIGFQPARVAQVQRKEGDILGMVGMHRRVESEIAGLWAEGIFENDKAKITRARNRLLDYNAKNPANRIVLTKSQLKSRVKQMALTRGERIRKTAPREIRGQVAAALQ